MLSIREFRRQMIVQHPTFMCPFSKEILDVDSSHIVAYDHPVSKEKKLLVVSFKGWDKLTDAHKAEINMRIIDKVEDL